MDGWSPITRFTLRVLICASVLSNVGCATSGPGSETYHPVWPPPPAEARIRHVVDIHTPDDLHKPSALDGLGRLLTGGGQQTLARPTGAAVVGEHLLGVTDQENQGVHLLRMNKAGASFASEAEKGLHFVSPVGIAGFGDLIAVSDSALNRVFLLTLDGKPAGEINKPDGFSRPTGMYFDTQHSELYVVDTLANQVCVFDGQGKMLRSFGGHGIEAGKFNYPTHVFVDRAGRVFVTDSMNFRVQVFDRQGQYQFDLGVQGDASGYLAVPKGVGVDTFGHIYIVDSYFSNVQVFDEDGRFLLSVGGPGDESGRFQVPTGLFVDQNNRIYICDSYNGRVQVLEYITGPSLGVSNHENDSDVDR